MSPFCQHLKAPHNGPESEKRDPKSKGVFIWFFLIFNFVA